jgi:hypothetical protein
MCQNELIFSLNSNPLPTGAPPNGRRKRRWSGPGTTLARILHPRRISQKMRPNPHRPLHAVLGGFLDWTGSALRTASYIKTYIPKRIKMIAQLSTAEEIIAGAARWQGLGTLLAGLCAEPLVFRRWSAGPLFPTNSMHRQH